MRKFTSKGAIAANKVETGSKAAATLTIKNLTIKGTDENVGLSLVGVASSGDATLKATSINIETGTLKTTFATDKVGKVEAGSITIGKNGVAAGKAVLDIGSTSTIGKNITDTYSENTSITLNEGALVQVQSGDSLEAGVIQAGNLTINSGEIKAAGDGKGTNVAKLNITLVDGSMNGGKITTAASDELKLAFATEDVKDNSVSVPKEFSINNGEIVAAGKITLTGPGKFSLADAATITSGAALGEFKVSGADTSNLTTLSLSKQALDNLAKNTKVSTTNAVLDITGNDQITLGTGANLTFAAASSAAANVIGTGADTTLKANNVRVDGNVANDSGKVTVEATNLTLAGTAASTLAGLKAQNVTFESSAYNQPYTLQDKLTLSSTTKVGDEIKATSGTITANPEGVLVSGGSAKSLTIDGGIYAADKLTVKSGSIAVSNTLADLSKLSIGTLALDNTSTGSADNAISVSGGTDKKAILDLSNTTLSLKGHGTNKTTITVGQNGTLLVSGENLAKLINKENAWNGTAGAGILINTGTVDTLLTDIDAELSVDDFKSNTTVTANTITFHTAGGTLNTQSLSLTDNNNKDGLSIGAGTIDVGGTLTLTAKEASGNFVVNTGNLVLANEVKSSNNAKLVLGKESAGSATLQLGDIYFDEDTNKIEHTADTGAKVDVDLVLDGNTSSAKSELNVKYGHWTAKDITAKNADITIGSASFAVDGANDDQDHKFGLTANSLTLNEEAKVTVHQNLEGSTQAQELVVGKLSTTVAEAITLNGDMTLKGDGSEANKFGLALKAKAISVEQGGSLTITDAALNAIKIEGDTVTIQDNAYATDALVSKTGSVVNLDFTSGTSLSDAALTQLRQKLFGLSDTEKLKGTLNVGDASIAGLPTVGSDGKVAWSDLAANKDVITDTTNNDLMNATVTGVTSTDPIRGSFGAVTSTQENAIVNDERLTLNDADKGYFAAQVDANGNLVKDSEGNVVALGFTVAPDTDLTLNNGGKAGNISLDTNSGLVIGGKTDGVTELSKVSGGDDASLDLLAGTLQVTNKDKKAEVSVGELSTAAGTTLKADKLTVSSTSEVAEIKGNLDITTKAEFKGKAKLSGQNTLAAVDFKDNASIVAGKTTVSGDLNVADTKKLSVIGGAALDVKTLKALGTDTEIFVGQSKDEPNGIDSTSGVLAANLFNLNGAYLVIDPEFGEAASFAGADIFGNDAQAEDAGIVHGNIYALQNAIASIGNKDEKEVKAKFAQFLDANTGSLQQDGVGAIAYVAKNVEINNGSKIVVDPTATDKTYTCV